MMIFNISSNTAKFFKEQNWYRPLVLDEHHDIGIQWKRYNLASNRSTDKENFISHSKYYLEES